MLGETRTGATTKKNTQKQGTNEIWVIQSPVHQT